MRMIAKNDSLLAFTGALLFSSPSRFQDRSDPRRARIAGIVAMNLAGYNVVPYNFGTMRIFGVLQRTRSLLSRHALIFLTHKLETAGMIGIGSVALLVSHNADTLPGCERHR